MKAHEHAQTRMTVQNEAHEHGNGKGQGARTSVAPAWRAHLPASCYSLNENLGEMLSSHSEL